MEPAAFIAALPFGFVTKERSLEWPNVSLAIQSLHTSAKPQRANVLEGLCISGRK
jgi:hypothetical protein